MSRLRYNRKAAAAHLVDRCDRLGPFVVSCGGLKLRVDPGQDVFHALARAIVYQQLSGKAASTIHGRFLGLLDPDRPAGAQAAALPMSELRAVGLSRNKALAIRDLAERAGDGRLASMRRLGRMNDEAVIENLCQVRGIGPWTAQMFLMFNLGRPDVMPATDLGVQKGVQGIYRLDDLPDPASVLEITRHLSPYRSAASWYFWRAADTVLMT